MIQGLRFSASALDPAMRAQEILSNNLANVNTPGFRQDRLAFHQVLGETGGPGEGGAGVSPAGAGSAAASGTPAVPSPRGPSSSASGNPQVNRVLDLDEGMLESTGSAYDLSLSGPGFFVVQGTEGELYTRDGSVHRGADGTLLHGSGYPLLGESGPIHVPEGGTLAVDADGTILVDGSSQGKLRVVELPDPGALHHAGANLIRSDVPGQEADQFQVVQGAREGSNGSAVETMVEMMTLLRGFEANQQAMVTQDGSLGELIRWASS